MLTIINFMFWLIVLGYGLYQRIMKSPKTLEDYAEIALIIFLMVALVFFSVLIS